MNCTHVLKVSEGDLVSPLVSVALARGMTGLRNMRDRLQRVESVSSALQAADIRPRVRGATGGRPRWMTAALSIPVIDSAALLGEPMTASCQAP